MSRGYPFAAVLFDLDGVLIDTTALHYRVWDEFARGRGFVPSKEQLLATNGRRADETIRLWLGRGLSDEQVAAITAKRERYFHRLLATEHAPAVPGRLNLCARCGRRAYRLPLLPVRSRRTRDWLFRGSN